MLHSYEQAHICFVCNLIVSLTQRTALVGRMTQSSLNMNPVAPERLPTSTHLEWSQEAEPRIERMHFHGGVVAVNHDTVLPSRETLSAREETYLALEAVGMDIPRMAEVTDTPADTIAHRRNKLSRKLGTEKVTNKSGRMAAFGFEEGIFSVVQTTPDIGLPRAMVEITYNTAQGRGYTEIGGLLGMDLNSVRARSYKMKQKVGLDNSAAMVFYGYASGLLAPVRATTLPSNQVLPQHVHLELSQAGSKDLRLERIHFHGGRLAIMHRIPLSRDPRIKPLTATEELTVALGAVGQSEAQTGRLIYRTEDEISGFRGSVFDKLRLPNRSTIGQAITVARNKGVFLVEQHAELDVPLNPKRIQLLEVLAQGGTRQDACRAVGHSLDTINLMISSLKETYQLNKFGDLVLLGHMSGALALERTII
jgi:DNA-binding CsgD family transcriptional regulator